MGGKQYLSRPAKRHKYVDMPFREAQTRKAVTERHIDGTNSKIHDADRVTFPTDESAWYEHNRRSVQRRDERSAVALAESRWISRSCQADQRGEGDADSGRPNQQESADWSACPESIDIWNQAIDLNNSFKRREGPHRPRSQIKQPVQLASRRIGRQQLWTPRVVGIDQRAGSVPARFTQRRSHVSC